MPCTAEPARVTATPAARSAITSLRAAVGGPVMFVQSGGCCAGSAPMCFPAGEFLVGDGDVLLGEIDGSPCYIDARLDDAWGTGASSSTSSQARRKASRWQRATACISSPDHRPAHRRAPATNNNRNDS